MIRSIKIELTPEDNSFTAREEKLIDIFILNVSVLVNALHTAKPMALNPVEQSDARFSLELVFQDPLEQTLGLKMTEDIEKRLSLAFDMAEIPLKDIKLKPNFM